jgi:hypothetical protein
LFFRCFLQGKGVAWLPPALVLSGERGLSPGGQAGQGSFRVSFRPLLDQLEGHVHCL